MKRFFILILCFAMLLSLTACGGKNGQRGYKQAGHLA